MQIKPFTAGQYRYLPAGFQYSAGVVAEPGYGIERARFSRPVPLAEGFQRIQAHLASLGRPSEALCACELRSPAVMSEPVFIAFNKEYVKYLAQMGLYEEGVNPVARCNLIPAVLPPAEPSLYAFSYTVPLDASSAVPDFVTSGAAECPDRPGYQDSIVRLGETSPDALGDKLRFALGDLESRFALMGVSWRDVTDMNLYTVHDLHHLLEQELVSRQAIQGGLCLHWVRPPVLDIEIEIDARKLSRTRLLPA
ncbi:MAG: hypothetical protein WCY07_05670 [Pigmentiphaga sp.]